MSNNVFVPKMFNRFTPEQIIEFAKQTKFCTEEKGQCFNHELCPVSHSTACCYHCQQSAHLEASEEDKAFIKEHFTCEDPRCFRAVAMLFLGQTFEKSKIKKIE